MGLIYISPKANKVEHLFIIFQPFRSHLLEVFVPDFVHFPLEKFIFLVGVFSLVGVMYSGYKSFITHMYIIIN